MNESANFSTSQTLQDTTSQGFQYEIGGTLIAILFLVCVCVGYCRGGMREARITQEYRRQQWQPVRLFCVVQHVCGPNARCRRPGRQD